MRTALIPVMFTVLLAGCASYITPGAKANLQQFAPPDIQAGFDTKPTNPFPASIAVVRLQSSTYSNYYLERNGGRYESANYTVIFAKEADEDSQLERVSNLEKVSGLTSINRMLIPERVGGDKAIRVAASRLQADLLFLYTFDTSFVDTDKATPLTVITLGLSPTRRIRAITTCSALLMDTRTGYIYSTYEVTAKKETQATSWGSRDTADQERRSNEREAFKKLVDEVTTSWPRLLKRT